VLLTAADLDDGLLPSGRLREPLSTLARAHAIVLSQDFSGPGALVPPAIESFAASGKFVWRMQRKLELPAAPPASPLVFCAIARPKQFFAQVRAEGITPAAEVEFRDHHRYDRGDVKRLLAMGALYRASGFLTTEKDAVNLGAFQADLNPFAIAVLKLVLDQPIELANAILASTNVAS
jgi:tetraacyldisaccharide 4'-kinase